VAKKLAEPRMPRFSIDDIAKAVPQIDSAFLNTPQYECAALGDELKTRIIVKVETLNPIRSFKGRGAELLVGHNKANRLVCASAGNFGQAMAYACGKRGVALTVFASVNANTFKVDRMRALGAEVILKGDDFDSSKMEARKFAEKSGARFVEDSLDVATVVGAGTIGLELKEFPGKIDSLLIPLGNGALLNGIAKIFKTYRSGTKIVAVQAAGAPAMVESLKSGKIISHDKINTIADGIGVRLPVAQALEDMKGLVDDTLLVKEESILLAMKLIHRHVGILVEPSGAVGVAAIMENKSLFNNQTVATILCGSNLTAEQMDKWIYK
jgi:threonine dehydratase